MPKKISFFSCSVLVIFICVVAYTSNAYPNESIDSTQNDLENIQQKINSLDKQIIQKTYNCNAVHQQEPSWYVKGRLLKKNP